ncbi:nucleoside ABC transporter membrane protein [Rhizobium sp. PP-F2F-G38]|uniref:ABC transporter permease n=1 Tax=Rhizobium sp. PP-CC-3G-465 TaxID=2135648 RepID=UPI000D97B60E|nr:nucleoside ABC transporter membrane protein [Rhizobium sp. PP-CC-3A-592]PYE35073.1 nucleoside ABC transporter membrane protein [Rhizobium sp. PP-WC-1G-195]PYE98879.1 nucleoside ABC transporter membrane protein [Rhizobium sp. PP-F2F-G38]TCP89698.1 nucleoside ABC transporter membrane protein [Rhizobium sp. PP-CC-2G-626]TCQ29798.1 nucleoside ABC transporter membrane protein [Rhizobium sp. PP-CC-3G-465]
MSNPYAKLPGWAEYGLIPLVNLVVAFLVAGLVVLLVGESPLEAAYHLINGAFGRGEYIGFTLYYATTFIFTGLAVAVASHAGLFNIGGEGQAYVGGIGVALVCLWLDRIMPWYVVFPLAILGSAAFGALWAFLPGWLQAKRGSHIVITTIMFNFIASSLMVYLLTRVLKPLGSMAPQTRTFEAGGQLPKLDWLLGIFGLDIGNAPFNISFLLALLAAFGCWLLIWRTRLGYEMRVMGHSPSAARYAGIKDARITVIAMMISGGLCGMMALNPIMGEQFRMQLDFVQGAGFVGIAVALMGRSHPAGIIPAAILFGMLYQGGAEIAFEMPTISRDMIVIIQGLVILFAGALENMFRPAIGRIFASVASSRSASSAAKGA